MLRVGITGHRDLHTKHCIEYKRTIHHQLKYLKNRYENLLLLSSIAEGADRLVVNEAITLDILYSIVLPMRYDIYVKDFDTKSKEDFDTLLLKAEKITVMPLAICRNAQYELASRYISDHSDLLIALWDGMYNGLQGGTSETVKYHLSQNKPLWHLKVDRKSI
jgi:hypothetical protein